MSSVSIAAWGFSFFAIFPRVRYRTRLAWCAVWMPLGARPRGPGHLPATTPSCWAQPARSPRRRGPRAWSCSASCTRRRPRRDRAELPPAHRCQRTAPRARGDGRVADWRDRRARRSLLLVLASRELQHRPVVPRVAARDARHISLPGAAAVIRLRHPAASAVRHRGHGPPGSCATRVCASRAARALVPVLFVFLGVDLLAHGDEPPSPTCCGAGRGIVSLAGLAAVAAGCGSKRGSTRSIAGSFASATTRSDCCGGGGGRPARVESRTGGADRRLAHRAGSPPQVRRTCSCAATPTAGGIARSPPPRATRPLAR